MIKLKLNQVCVGKRKVTCRRVPYNTANRAMHWTVKSLWKKAWEEEVYWAVIKNRKSLGKLPIKFARIEVILSNTRLMDYDGAYASVKPILDGLRYAGVILDDSPKYIDLKVKQMQVSHREDEGVEINIE